MIHGQYFDLLRLFELGEYKQNINIYQVQYLLNIIYYYIIVFSQEVVQVFLKRQELDLICRAHQAVEDGYEFFSKRQLVTIFSAPYYCGGFDNAGTMIFQNRRGYNVNR